MKAAVSGIEIPTTVSEAEDVSQMVWEEFSNNLQLYSPSELNNWISQSKDYLFELSKCKDNASLMRLLVGLESLCHFFLEKLSELNPLFDSLLCCQNSNSMLIVSTFIAKIAAKTYETNEKFSRRYLNRAIVLIKARTDNASNMMGLFLIREISSKLPYFFVYNCPSVNQLLWPYLISNNDSIRALSLDVFSKYLNLVTRAYGNSQMFSYKSIFQHCTSLIQIGKKCVTLGALEIISIIVQLRSIFFEQNALEIYEVMKPLMKSREIDIRAGADKCVSLISLLDPDFFLDNIWADFFDEIKNLSKHQETIPNILNILLCIVKWLPQAFKDYSAQLVQLLKNISTKAKHYHIKLIVDILAGISKLYPFILNDNPEELFQVVKHIMFDKFFIDYFPSFIKSVPSFMEVNFQPFVQLIITSLKENSSNVFAALKLVPQIGNIPEDIRENLYHLANGYLLSNNGYIRVRASRAILFLRSHQKSPTLIMNILGITLSEPDAKVRVAFVDSFQEEYYTILSQKPLINFFDCLTKDESPLVRISTFNLLKKLRKYSPINVDCILKDAISTHFMIIQCVTLALERTRYLQSFPALLDAAFEIVHLYSPSILTLCTHVFSTRGKEVLSIESDHENKLTYHLIQTIQVILTRGKDLILPHIKTIFPLFTTILGEYSDEYIKAAIIQTFSSFVSQSQSPAEVYSIAPLLLENLMNIISNSNSTSLRVDAIKLIGQIGAVTPRRVFGSKKISPRIVDYDFHDLYLLKDSSLLNIYFGKYIINKLLLMVEDKSLSSLREKTLTTAIAVLEVMENHQNQTLEKIVTIVINSLSEKEEIHKNIALYQLERLIHIAKQRITPYIPEIMKILTTIWQTTFLNAVITVITALVCEVHTDFSDFWGPIVPKLLETLASTYYIKPDITLKCMKLIALLSPAQQSICHLALPQICNIIQDEFVELDVRIGGLEALQYIIQFANTSNHYAVIFSSIIDICSHKMPNVSSLGKNVLYSLLVKVGVVSSVYRYRVQDVFENDKVARENCINIIDSFEEYPNLNIDDFKFIKKSTLNQVPPKQESPVSFDPLQIIHSFTLKDMATTTRWTNWYRKALLNLISNAPCLAIHECFDLANVHQPLADYLFFPALFSTWKQLSNEFKSLLSKKFSEILYHPLIPIELLQKFVFICELMEKAETPLLIGTEDFLKLCARAKLNSLAFYIAQEKFLANPSPESTISIIQIAYQANHLSTVKNLIKKVPKNISRPLLMKLGQWDIALQEFGEAINCPDPNIEDFVDFLQAACNVHRYDLILNQKARFEKIPKSEQKRVAINFAEASFFAKDYKMMNYYASMMDSDSLNAQITLALSMILTNQWDHARYTIDNAFKIIAQQHSQKFKSLYSQVYNVIVTSQILYELTEIIDNEGAPPRDIWKHRLANCEVSSEVWWEVLKPRLIYTPDDNFAFTKGMSIFLQEKQFNMFDFLFKFQYPNFDIKKAPPNIVLQYLRYQWVIGNRQQALNQMQELVRENQNLRMSGPLVMEYTNWMFIIYGQKKQTLLEVASIIESLLKKTPSGPLYEKWAITNYMLYKQNPEEKSYAINAVKGFVPCVKSQHAVNFADIALLISVFFEAATDDFLQKTSDIFNSMQPILFVEAIPQLISQVGHWNPNAKMIAERIIKDLMKNSIQKLIFPLYVGTESGNEALSLGCKNLIHYARNIYADIVREAKKLRLSLISAASTLFENWILFSGECLEDLLYNIKNPECPMDRLFMRLNYDQLEKLMQNLASGEDVTKIIETINAKCEKFICSIDNIRICDITDDITELQPKHILIPGGPPSVFISTIKDSLTVLSSKQHPRKLEMTGTDGNDYVFLLKKNEDLQLDLRVMQFFALINIVVKKDFFLASESISLRLYEIVPLSHDIGLIQWINGSDALHDLISDYRKAHSIDQALEGHLITEKTISDFNLLRPIQRMEALNEVDEETSSDDLRKIFWLKSANADAWLEKTLHFQKSMGISSITGYILGLGDRHALNIMIDRMTGEVIHIDFGDCFEVNMFRISFPELIPFRLTRMIVRSFVIGDIDCDFKQVCEQVMTVSRENASTIISVIEMFLREPQEYEPDEYEIEQREMIIRRLWDKVNGRDFDPRISLSVNQQVDMLITAARDKYNLAHLFSGWCPLW